MSSQETVVIDGETGEVFNTSLIPIKGGETLTELIPYNKMTNIAKATLTRIKWDVRQGYWSSDMGDSGTLQGELVKASELFAIWSDVVGQPEYIGFEMPENPTGEVVKGYRLAIDSQEFGPCYFDLFGLASRAGSAACKVAVADKSHNVKFDGSVVINTKNGVFYIPKLVR